MKNRLKAILCSALCAAFVLPAAACGGVEDDPNTLNVICLKEGYSSEWIETLAAEFEADTGYKVNLTATADAKQLISSHLASRRNVDDLYISVGADWKQSAAKGEFASLDDLLDQEVDGVKVKDKVLDEYSQSLYLPDSNGELHTYRLPWTASFGGIFYNSAMFKKFGWDTWLNETYSITSGTPETYEQLMALCEHISNDTNASITVSGKAQKIKPFMYTTANTDYFDYGVFTWWGQLAGQNAIKEFMKYPDSSIFDYNKNETYAALKTATDMWYGIFGNTDYYDKRTSNHDAQTAFNNGYAAMMFNGDWVYNEILKYEIDNKDFSLAVMKTPLAANAKDSSIVYTVGEDQFVAIPASSAKQDMAKQFIKYMISDHGCEVFLNKAHGILAYKGSYTANTDDAFMKNLINVKKGYDHAFTSYPPVKDITDIKTKSVMLNLTGRIDVWGTSALRPFERVLGNSADEGEDVIATAFSEIYTEINKNWDTWKKAIGLN